MGCRGLPQTNNAERGSSLKWTPLHGLGAVSLMERAAVATATRSPAFFMACAGGGGGGGGGFLFLRAMASHSSRKTKNLSSANSTRSDDFGIFASPFASVAQDGVVRFRISSDRQLTGGGAPSREMTATCVGGNRARGCGLDSSGRGQDFVNAMTSLRIPKGWGRFWAAERLSPSPIERG